MFVAYGTIDDAIHEGKSADYEAVATQLDENMAAIAAVAEGAAAK
jgi:hypothetical protein